MRNRTALAVAALAFGLCAAPPTLAKDIVIHAGRLIDGTSRTVRSNVSVIVRDDRIVSVTQGFTDAPGAEVIDLSRETVLPGLIDSHVHLLLRVSSSPQADRVTHTPYDDLLVGVQNARSTLLAGFTSVRDVGGYTPSIVALKKAIGTGAIEGPRMWVSGSILSPTGGHGDASTGYDPELTKPEWTDGIVDGADEAARKVREHHRAGADLIKIAASGGVISIGDDPHAQLMTDAEIRAVVETAHTLHMKVAAHVHGKGATEHAVEIGVDSIEHGSFADEATYRVMKAHGTYLVPTLIAGASVVDYAKAHPEKLPPGGSAKAIAVGAVMSHNAGAAYKAGVKIAFGTDAGVYPHGQNAKEFRLMVDAGIPPMDAILTATAGAADLIGDADDIGSIQPGRYADIIATREDPLVNIDALQRVDFVMKGGQVVKPAAP
jgi:imidazolonepropionase-like amidohydrolase